MTVQNEDEDFAAALREAAHSIDTPHAEALYEGAVHRGRRIRRRRALGTGATTAVALGAAGVLAATLSVSGAGPGPAETAAPGGNALVACRFPIPRASFSTSQPDAKQSVAPPAAAGAVWFPLDWPGPSTALPSFQPLPTPLRVCGAPFTEAFLTTFERALPADMKPDPGKDGLPSASEGLLYRDAGDRGYRAVLSVPIAKVGSRSYSTVAVYAANAATIVRCPATAHTSPSQCTAYDGGQLFVTTMWPPVNGDRTVAYAWTSPAGYQTGLWMSSGSTGAFPLTESEVLSVLTDPAWRTFCAELS